MIRCILSVAVLALTVSAAVADEKPAKPAGVRCAILTYADDKTAVCFSDAFLAEMTEATRIKAEPQFAAIKLDTDELFAHPFAVMSGEGEFTLSESERQRLRAYLQGGGFLLASAGCSSQEWDQSFRRELAAVLPDAKLAPIPSSHPVFSTVHTIDAVRTKHLWGKPKLEGVELDGRLVLVYSADGLNDTASVGGSCCCCGGNEVVNARQINVNLLAYALTH